MNAVSVGEGRAAVVIEDDLDIRNLVCAILEQGGFQVSGAITGRDGVAAVRREEPTVVTLDLGLPDIDGYEVLRRIRSTTDCYVVVLTARDDEMDILTALQAGADDYVVKPFRPRELRARIDALLRRPRARPATPDAEVSTPVVETNAASASNMKDTAVNVLRHGKLAVDGETRTAECAGVELALTKTEFNLLFELLQCKGAVRTKEELVRVSRGKEYRGYNFVSRTDERAIEVHIANLRQKLARGEGNPDLITTVRGVGFRIVPQRSS